MTDTDNKVKRTIRVAAGKVVDAANQTKRGAQTVVDKAGDAGNQIRQGAQVAANKVADVGGKASRTVQTTTVKIADAGDQIADSAQVTAIKVIDAAQKKFVDLKTFTDQHWNKFSKDVGEASQRYADVVTDSLILANDKLKESTEVIDPGGTIRGGAKKAAIAVGAATVSAYNQILAASPAFHELPLALKAKFVVAGMRGVWRTLPIPESLYDASVPQMIRNFGKDAVIEFLNGKHLRCVTHRPWPTIDDSKMVWVSTEYRPWIGDLTGAELARINTLNMIDAAGIVAGRTLQIAAKAGCVGMALEGVVSLGENMIYVYAGERSVKEAAVDLSRNMTQKGILSAVSGLVVSAAIAFGAGPALSAMAPVMVTAGGTVFLVCGSIRSAPTLSDRVSRSDFIVCPIQTKAILWPRR